MNKTEFANYIKDQMEGMLEGELEISVQEICKNNGIMKTGLIVKDIRLNIAPTIYLDELFEEYQKGRPIDDVVKVVYRNLKNGMPKEKVDLDFFSDFEQVKDKICHRLVNYEKNQTTLEDVPHLPFLDLAICFYYAFSDEMLGKGSILIRNSHAKKWGVTTSELWKIASENTRRLYPEECFPMENMLMELMGMKEGKAKPEDIWEEAENDPEEHMMRVLTNQQRHFGASVILYENLLGKLSDKLSGDLYIIPSSIHEVLILTKCEGEAEHLGEIIQEVNRECIDPQEVLSDHLYLYDRGEKRMKIVS